MATGAGPTAPAPAAVPVVDDNYAPLRARTRERFEAVHRLREQGMGLRTVARELGLDRKTVRRFVTAASPDEVIAAATSRVVVLDKFVPYLLEQWNAGITDVAVLTAELHQLGYRGSRRTVYRYLQTYRSGRKPVRPVAIPPALCLW